MQCESETADTQNSTRQTDLAPPKNASTYTGGNNGIICADGSTAGLQRYTPDTGSNYWSYGRTQVSGNHWQTLITDPTTPTANQTLIDFQQDSATSANTNNFFETRRAVIKREDIPVNGAGH